MARLIYSTLSSLDHYVADADGKWEFAEPAPEVPPFVNAGDTIRVLLDNALGLAL